VSRASIFRLFIVLSACLATSAAVADDFEIELKVAAGKKPVQTKLTRLAVLRRKLGAKKKKQPPRLIVNAKAGQSVTIDWVATNTGKTDTLTGLLVHFFVVKIDKVGQEKVPKLDNDVVHEGILALDFKPKEKASGQFALSIRKPGSYLVRVETIGTLISHGHEHYAAVDLVIEQED
jgi:hypothetical protein